MCLVCFELDWGPLVSKCMVNSVSWNIMFCLIVYPWASIKYLLHNAWGSTWSAPTSSDLVELLLLIRYFDNILVTTPFPAFPRDIMVPVWLLQSIGVRWEASLHHFITDTSSADKVSFMCRVPCRYQRTFFNSPQSSLSDCLAALPWW